MTNCPPVVWFFFFNDTATTEIYTLSLHDALPISGGDRAGEHAGEVEDPGPVRDGRGGRGSRGEVGVHGDRKSTRLNSSHPSISYAVFCLKKKKRNSTVRNCRQNRPPDGRRHALLA